MNEDLNAQLLTTCLTEGRSLVNEDRQNSLAAELAQLTKEEVIVFDDSYIMYLGICILTRASYCFSTFRL